MRKWLFAWGFSVALAVGFPAFAGRTSHLLAEESQTVPEGDVELEQWVWGEGRVPDRPNRPVITWIWWAPVIGVTPHLELGFPLQLVSGSEALELDSIGIDARYRFFPRQDDEGLQPLVQVSYAHPLGPYGRLARLDVNVVAQYGAPTQTQFTANVGGSFGLPFLSPTSDSADAFLTSAAGVSVPVLPQLRLAAELFDRAPLHAPSGTANVLYAGASIAWTHGPFWVTAGALFGLTSGSPHVFPKVLWAVEL
jgi:hypothetical protein